MLIALHVWTSKGIYEVLGRFGWFYGDFFIASETAPPQLVYTGIYRHVNNPERSKPRRRQLAETRGQMLNAFRS